MLRHGLTHAFSPAITEVRSCARLPRCADLGEAAASDPDLGPWSYAYDDAHHLTSQTAAVGRSTTFTYDNLGRLTTKNEGGTALTLTYDSTRPVHAPKTVNGSGYTYDANGNLTSRPGQALTYDVQNRLTRVQDGGGAQLLRVTYDGDGQRVITQDSRGTIVSLNKLYEKNLTTQAETIFVYAGGRLIATKTITATGSTVSTVHPDHLGGVAVTMQGNNVVADSAYFPYGSTRATSYGTSALPTDRQFNGESYNAATGLYQMGARWYDGAIGRWIQPDTIIPSPGNPQSLNRFSYVTNNPLRYTDPSGHDPAFVDVWVGFIVQIGYNNAWMSPQAHEALAAQPNESVPMTAGRHLGNAASVLQGTAEILGGGATAIGGAATCGTGVLCPAGAMAVVGGATAVAHGATVAGVAVSQEGEILGANLFSVRRGGQQFLKFTRQNFRENLWRLTGKVPKNSDAHHVFPQKHGEKFGQAGIDIDDPQYGTWWNTETHHATVAAYDREWDRFLGEGKRSRGEILEFGRQLAGKYGFDVHY